MTEPTDDETGNGDDCVPANGHEHCFVEAIRLRDQIERLTKDRDRLQSAFDTQQGWLNECQAKLKKAEVQGD